MPATPGRRLLVLRTRDATGGSGLRAELGPLSRQTEQDMRAAVWFEDGAVVRHDRERGRVFDVHKADDPVLRAQECLRELQQRHGFTYTRAASFADRGQ